MSNIHWDAVAERIITEDFYTYASSYFSRNDRTYATNQPVDLLTLDNALRNKNIADDVGGFAYLAGV